jgi:hypothetical protein
MSGGAVGFAGKSQGECRKSIKSPGPNFGYLLRATWGIEPKVLDESSDRNVVSFPLFILVAPCACWVKHVSGNVGTAGGHLETEKFVGTEGYLIQFSLQGAI